MKRGSNVSGRTMAGVGVNLSWRTTTSMGQNPIVPSRAGRPYSVGIWSERVEAVEGAAGRTTWTCCGRLGRRDERTRQALRCISRSLVSARAVHHSLSRWRRPAAGWGGCIELLKNCTDGVRILERVNFEEKITGGSN